MSGGIDSYEAVNLPVGVCVAYIATECVNPHESLARNTPHASHEDAEAEAVDIAGTTGRPTYVTKVYVRKSNVEAIVDQKARLAAQRKLLEAGS